MNMHYMLPATNTDNHAITPEAEFLEGTAESREQDPVATRRKSAQPGFLILKYALTNIVASALVAAAWMQGWITTILASDETGLVLVIVGTFLAGLALCGFKVWRVSCELNCVRTYNPCADSWATQYLAQAAGRKGGSRAISGSALRLRIAGWIAPVRHFANSLVLLGLIGTVVGFVIALSGIDSDAASDVSAISPMVSNLLAGMSVALYTTLVGSVLNLWLTVNHHLLSAGGQELLLDLIALGEKNARD